MLSRVIAVLRGRRTKINLFPFESKIVFLSICDGSASEAFSFRSKLQCGFFTGSALFICGSSLRHGKSFHQLGKRSEARYDPKHLERALGVLPFERRALVIQTAIALASENFAEAFDTIDMLR